MLNLNQLKILYTQSPDWIKNLYGYIPFDIRNGLEYRKWKKFLAQELSIEEYEIIKLRETVLYAYKNTVYYKELFDELHLSPYDIKERKDILSIPCLDKELVKQNYDKLVVNGYPKKKQFYVSTGGTSGTPMKFLQSKNMWAKEVAFIMNYFFMYGFNPNSMKKASFRGGDFQNLKPNEYWKESPHASEIQFSPFHISDQTIKAYVDKLNKEKMEYFQTYPSSLKLLIESMKKNNLTLDYQVKAIFLLSENILDEDISLFKSFFKTTISSFYGHTERVIFAPSHDQELNSFQIDRRYGLFELINNENNLIEKDNVLGEMVGTSFDNYVMPLIRYKTNDFTSYDNKDNYIIHKMEGRWKQEYLIGSYEQKVYLTALNMHSNVFNNVIKYQFVQNIPGSAQLCIITTNDFTKAEKDKILDELQKKAGHIIKFSIKIVDKLVLTHNGKFKNIVKNF